MNTRREVAPLVAGYVSRIFASGIGPQIMLAPPGDGNDDTAAAAVAAAAAEAAATARLKAETDAAVIAAAKVEADRIAAEEELKNETADKKLIREVMEKKAALKLANEEKTALEAKLKSFEGIDVEAVKVLLKEKADAALADAEKKGEFDRVKAAMIEQAAAEKAEIEAKFKTSQEAISAKDEVIAKLTFGNSFASSEFIRNDMHLSSDKAQLLYGRFFEVGKDGVMVAYDTPVGSSTRTPLVNAKGENLSFDEALRKIVDKDPDKETLLKSKVIPGPKSKTTETKQTADRKPGELFGAARILASLNAAKA